MYKDKEFLHQKYVVEKLSLAQIASQISSSKMVIGKYLRYFEIPLRAANQPHGRPSQPKFGSRIQHGSVTTHLGERRVINAIQELRGQGLTLRQIARFLSQAGVPTKCRGKRWHPQMIKRVLDSEAEKEEVIDLLATVDQFKATS
jgi:hypothetical protein